MKKRWIAGFLAAALCLGTALSGCGTKQSEEETGKQADEQAVPQVQVSIAVQGEIVLPYAAVDMEDQNGDGVFSIDEALALAHETYADEAHGYASEDGDFGRYLTQLWGDTSGNCGYYVNNTYISTDLTSELKEGDYVYAYVIQDTQNWSDSYAYFDTASLTAEAGQTISLTLNYITFDEEYQPVVMPVSGAVITVDGTATEVKTDESGKAELTIEENGTHVISAVSGDETLVLVPPVCVAEISGGETAAAADSSLETLLQDTVDWSLAQQPSDWAMMGLGACGAQLPQSYQDAYLQDVQNRLAENDGELGQKYTEYSRMVLALTAAGYHAADFEGQDLTQKLADVQTVSAQGVNGTASALLALASGDYACLTEELEQQYVQALLQAQREDGGWDLRGEKAPAADADVTAMVLQALAQVQSCQGVPEAVERGLACLSQQQNEDGGFSSYGQPTLESCAQVILALCELDLPLDDARFVKDGNTIYDAMLRYRNDDGGFAHVAQGETMAMSTYQAQLALTALQRRQAGQATIFQQPNLDA